MDFGAAFKVKQVWDSFTANHPKLPLFINAVNQKGIGEGTIIDVRLTYPNGEKLESNLKLSAEDLQLLASLKDLKP